MGIHPNSCSCKTSTSIPNTKTRIIPSDPRTHILIIHIHDHIHIHFLAPSLAPLLHLDLQKINPFLHAHNNDLILPDGILTVLIVVVW
ncbi:hypothetical protein I7I48_05010 [Histoplasma ohiense]|nr:hypothetical protein I7I48_05010 [Histoplasma ohiense (nom. inval.)]